MTDKPTTAPDSTDPPRENENDTAEAAPEVAFFMPGLGGTEDRIVGELVARLSESLRDVFEERAGIMEFDAGMSRGHAECLALLNIYRDHPLEVLGVGVFRKSSGEYLLVTDPEIIAREGLTECRQGLVDRVIAEFGGIVRLVRWRQV